MKKIKHKIKQINWSAAVIQIMWVIFSMAVLIASGCLLGLWW